jgi:hypothetical protein
MVTARSAPKSRPDVASEAAGKKCVTRRSFVKPTRPLRDAGVRVDTHTTRTRQAHAHDTHATHNRIAGIAVKRTSSKEAVPGALVVDMTWRGRPGQWTSHARFKKNKNKNKNKKLSTGPRNHF